MFAYLLVVFLFFCVLRWYLPFNIRPDFFITKELQTLIAINPTKSQRSSDAGSNTGHMGLPGRHGKILDLSRFDAQFFHTNPKQAHVMDPQLRMLLETSYEAIFDAGYDPDTLRKRSIGVFIANSNSESYYAFRKDDKVDSNYLLGCARSMFSNRISYSLDLQGV
ncbi:hypothetical protein MRX96_056087 [Rhipicephalus microplus]